MPDLLKRSLARRIAVTGVACGALGLAVLSGAAQQPAAGPGAAEPDEAMASRLELDRLHARIGRFASGEVAVYAGTLEAAEDRPGAGRRTLPPGRVVAALEHPGRLPGRAEPAVTLTAVSAVHGLWLRLGQAPEAPGVTWSTLLRPLRASAGVSGSCRGCLADLGRRPRAVRFDRFAAAGRLGDLAGTEFRIEISGRLEQVPPGELELADVELLAPGLGPYLADEAEAFTVAGGEGVRRVERTVRRRVPAPPESSPHLRCERVVRYAAERFVDPADLTRFGVRDVRILGTEVCCLDHDDHGEAEVCSAEVAR